MADLLRPFLRRSLSEPFIWGERDCAFWAWAWVAEARGHRLAGDPIGQYRGRYTTRLGCARLLKREGGIERLCRRIARRAGLKVTRTPVPGDVGLIATPAGLALGIRIARGWAWKSGRGFAVAPAVAVVAWRV